MVDYLNNIFLVFKQHYTYFHILFHSHVFQKITNNITQNPLPTGPDFLGFIEDYNNNNSNNTTSSTLFLIILDGWEWMNEEKMVDIYKSEK